MYYITNTTYILHICIILHYKYYIYTTHMYYATCITLQILHIYYTYVLYYMYYRGVGTGGGGATGARAPLVLQQAKLTYKAYVGLSLRDPVGSADHMAQGVCDAIGIATQYSYIIVRHYLEL